MMKRIILNILIIALMVSCAVIPAQALNPGVEAQSAILIDGTTGAVLYSNNAHKRLPIASTTKIMTAIVVLEHADLNGMVKISKEVEDTGESEMGLARNEKIKAETLLEAMMVHSANDAAVALAIYTSGNVKNFVALMNKEAKKIGAKDTHFMDPDGLTSVNHYSTAYDMAIIGRYAMQNPLFRTIVAKKKITINGKEKLSFLNRNKLLFRYAPAVGIKTGYTKPAGFCLVSAAIKNNRFLIATTLNSQTSNGLFLNAQKILDFGYKNYKYVNVAEEGKQITMIDVPFSYARLPLIAEQNIGYFKSDSKITSNIILSYQGDFPIKKNSVRGWIEIKKDGKVVSKTALLAGKSFDNPSLWQKITFIFSNSFNGTRSFFNKMNFQ